MSLAGFVFEIWPIRKQQRRACSLAAATLQGFFQEKPLIPFVPKYDVAQHAEFCVRPVIALCPAWTAGADIDVADKHVTWRRSSGTAFPGFLCRSLNYRLKKKK
jgi:hypothetical protein